MALTHTPPAELGFLAPDFSLLSTENQRVSLSDFNSHRGLLVIFMCNHCPYVQAIRGRLADLSRWAQAKNIAVVGINSNDSERYPDDSFEAMQKEVARVGYPFPYLWDETQKVARDYGAVCTPDFFLFQASPFQLVYRGRMDDSWKNPDQVKIKDLQEAMNALLEGRPPLQTQIPSMGCSIKWKP